MACLRGKAAIKRSRNLKQRAGNNKKGSRCSREQDPAPDADHSARECSRCLTWTVDVPLAFRAETSRACSSNRAKATYIELFHLSLFFLISFYSATNRRTKGDEGCRYVRRVNGKGLSCSIECRHAGDPALPPMRRVCKALGEAGKPGQARERVAGGPEAVGPQARP